METEIQSFYKDKCVFLTGGTGFLGKVFIEKILRATEVKRVYLLIRSKKGKNIYERIEDIFKDPLFDQLHKTHTNPHKRIFPIIGDCLLPDLGITENDRNTLIENVDVVVHGAATVRFNEPMSTALAINVRATMDLIKLAKMMFNLKAFVHVSSAFANCTTSHISEQFYTDKLEIDAERANKISEVLGSNIINLVSKQMCKDFPNTYCFTKALAEEAVLTQGNDLPICIFRPGIVVPTCKEPVSGWIDNLYGPTSILYGVATGVLRVMYMRINANAHIVPVDFCANMMLTCAWNTAKTANQINDLPPKIYNLVPEEYNIIKWSEYRNVVESHGLKMPLTRTAWFPFLLTTDSKLFYKLLCFLYHTLPGYLFDIVLTLAGKKPRMAKTYRKIHRQTELLDYFAENEWTFTTDNAKQLWKSLSAEDQHLFCFDMKSIDWQQYFYESLQGMRKYLGKEQPDTIPKALQQLKRLLILHRATQCLVYGGSAALLLWCIA